MEIRWTDRVRNEELLHIVKVERNILNTIKGLNGNWIGHILHRNCLIKRVTEGRGNDISDGMTGKKT